MANIAEIQNNILSDSGVDVANLQPLLTNPVTGTGTAGQVSYWSGTSTVTGSDNLFWNNVINRLGIGTNAPAAVAHIVGVITPLFIDRISDTTSGGVIIGRKARGTIASPTSVLANDELTAFGGRGYHSGGEFGSSIVGGVFIYANENFTSTAQGTYISFTTTANGSISRSEKLRILGSGNVIIQNGGTFTDNGQRLQVYGSTLLRGSGTTSATTALLVQNSTPTELFKVRDDGFIQFGSNNNLGIVINNNGTNTPVPAGVSVRLNHLMTTEAQNGFIFKSYFDSLTATSGTQTNAAFSQSFRPTSGTAQFNQVILNFTVDQTGGANGITRGLYIQPNIISAADWRSIEFSNNTGRGIWGVGTADNAVAGNLNVGSATVANSSAVLEVTSTTKGFLPPRMTTTQRDAIATPAAGLEIYNTTTNTNDTYNGTAWTSEITGTGTAGQVAYWNGTTTQTGKNNLFFDATNNRLGVNVSSPQNALDVTVGSLGAMSRNAYEAASFSTNGDTKVGIYTGSTSSSGAAFVLGSSQLTASGYYPGFEFQHQTNTNAVDNQFRINGLGRAINGTVVAASINLLRLFMDGRVIFNSSSFTWPTAASTRVLIGGATDNGQRLQVYGSTLLRGSGTTSATTALLVQNSTPSNLFTVADDGVITIGAFTTIFNTGTRTTFSAAGGANVNYFRFTTATALTSTTSNTIFIDYVASFSPTSGTGTFSALSYTGLINQTGGANGITRGLYVNPTLTSAADWRGIESVAASNANHTLLKLRNATVDVFTVKADSKIGFFNATPVDQRQTTSGAATLVGGGGTALTDTDTFDGYTLATVVKALRDLGLLA